MEHIFLIILRNLLHRLLDFLEDAQYSLFALVLPHGWLRRRRYSQTTSNDAHPAFVFVTRNSKRTDYTDGLGSRLPSQYSRRLEDHCLLYPAFHPAAYRKLLMMFVEAFRNKAFETDIEAKTFESTFYMALISWAGCKH